MPVCEDIWLPDIAASGSRGAELLLVPNGSPWHDGKQQERLETMRQRVSKLACPLFM